MSELRRSWLGANRLLLSCAAAFTVAVLAAVTVGLLNADPTPFTWYLFGAMHLGTVIALVAVINTLFLAHSRIAIHQLRGAWGEENTRDELRRAKRKRLVWDWVDSVTFSTGDLDHFVVTRRGGLVVLDSKWRSDPSEGITAGLIDDARRARTRAEALSRTLLAGERGVRHRQRRNPLTVRPAVVVWGALQQAIDAPVVVDGVDVFSGHDLCAWFAALDGEVVHRDAARDILDRVKAFRASTWPSKPGLGNTPTTVTTASRRLG